MRNARYRLLTALVCLMMSSALHASSTVRIHGIVRGHDGSIVGGAVVGLADGTTTRTSPSGSFVLSVPRPDSGWIDVDVTALEHPPATARVRVPEQETIIRADVILPSPEEQTDDREDAVDVQAPSPAASPFVERQPRRVRLFRGVPILDDEEPKEQQPAVAPLPSSPPPATTEPSGPPIEVVVMGRILGPRRRSVEGAVVSLPKYRVRTTTDSRGRFELRFPVPASRVVDGFTLVVDHPRYDRAQVPLEIRPQEANVIELDVEVRRYRGRLDR